MLRIVSASGVVGNTGTQLLRRSVSADVSTLRATFVMAHSTTHWLFVVNRHV